MKLTLAFLILSSSIAFAEVTDIKVNCLNSKGEFINDSTGYFRIERESVKLYNDGGFAAVGQPLVVEKKRVGSIQARFEPCSARAEDANKTILFTCTTSSSIEYLNRIIPDDRNACR